MYSYHYYNTKHVFIPLLQYKTCKPTNITIQNMYTYHYYNTKHVFIPLLQYKNVHLPLFNTKHVLLPLGTEIIIAYFQDMVFRDVSL